MSGAVLNGKYRSIRIRISSSRYVYVITPTVAPVCARLVSESCGSRVARRCLLERRVQEEAGVTTSRISSKICFRLDIVQTGFAEKKALEATEAIAVAYYSELTTLEIMQLLAIYKQTAAGRKTAQLALPTLAHLGVDPLTLRVRDQTDKTKAVSKRRGGRAHPISTG